MVKRTILNPKIIQSITDFKEILKKKHIPVDKMILFGSRAKGKAKSWSDIDLCVVSKTFGKDGYDELVMLMRLTPDCDYVIEPHPYHPKDLRDKWDSLAYEIRKYGVEV